jgi:iron complex outermembrane receptor protein
LLAIATSLGAICRPAQTQYDTFAGGNPLLRPEESRNASVGVVFQATPAISLGADYWKVGIKHAFGQIEETAAFDTPDLFPGAWTSFTDIGTGTTYIAYNQTNINTGKERYSGIDFNLQGRWSTPWGKLRSQLVTTYMLTNKLQLTEDGPYYSNIGDYNTELDEPTFRWNGRLMTSLDQGAWTHTLTANYKSGYKDVETTVDGINADGTFNGEVLDVRLHADNYLTFDWQSTWQVQESIGLTLGILNVFNKDPPRSLTGSSFQIGYDSRFYDPRGRVLFAKATMSF